MVLALLFATSVYARTDSTYIPDPLETLDNKEEYLQWVKIEAGNYNVSESLMICLINHENRPWDTTLQSGYFKNGKQEQSYGLSQIHLPSHPDITHEQATNPKFAISWMASELSLGRAWQWSTLKYCK